MSGPIGFLARNTDLATRNPKFRTEIEPECGKSFFFWSSPEFGAEFRDEIELSSLTKLRKNISPPRNLLNQQKIDAEESAEALDEKYRPPACHFYAQLYKLIRLCDVQIRT